MIFFFGRETHEIYITISQGENVHFKNKEDSQCFRKIVILLTTTTRDKQERSVILKDYETKIYGKMT